MTRSPMHPGDIIRIRGQRWRVTHAAEYERAVVLSVGGCDGDNRGVHARFLLPAEQVDLLPASDTPRFVSPRRWRRSVRGMLADALPGFESLHAATLAQIALLPFQLEPALAVVGGRGARLLIADDVGLGKTIQAGLILAETLHRHRDARLLVVSPASLREQWRSELACRFGLHAVMLDAAAVMRLSSSETPGVNPWAACSLVITSIDYVKRPEVIRSLESLVWDVMVFDEAHGVSGASDRAAAARGLARRARVVVLLSATPHSGDAAAFSRLCSLGLLAGEPLLVFRRTRQDAGVSASRATRWLRVRATPAEIGMHEALVRHARLVWSQASPRTGGARLAMTVLLKRACSSAAALARSIERRLQLLASAGTSPEAQLILPYDPDDADGEPLAALAVPGLNDGVEERRQLEEILALAHAVAGRDSKLRVLQRWLRRTREPAVIFTEYRDTLAHLHAHLPATAVLLHGAMTASERREAVRAFTTGDVRLLLATDAASEGLNLHDRCRLVLTLELPWTPARLEQRVGRVDRLGQQARVHAVHLVGRDTPEEGTVLRLLARQTRAQQDLEPSGGAASGERAVAQAIVGVPDPTDAAARSWPAAPLQLPPPAPALVFPALGDTARAEARRIATWRALRDPHTAAVDSRPPVTRLRPRGGARPRSYWAVRVPILDGSARVCWSIVAAADTGPADVPRDPACVRAIFNRIATEIQAALDDGRLSAVEVLRSLGTWSRFALLREEHIAQDVRETRARLAALQPSLFDRRAERDLAAQAGVLDEALERCRTRIVTLESLAQPRLGPIDPLFAVLIG